MPVTTVNMVKVKRLMRYLVVYIIITITSYNVRFCGTRLLNSFIAKTLLKVKCYLECT